jgi:hypothetical protein
MKKFEALTKDQLIDQIAVLTVLYKKRFGKSLGVTAEIGEYKAAKLLKLRRAEGNINKGFDAYDLDNRKVQIKSRVTTSKTQRTGTFSSHKFDYALLVLLSDNYDIKEIYRADHKQIEKAIENQSYSRRSLPIGKFIAIGKPVYPKA